MEMLKVAPIYAAIFAFMLVGLSFYVIKMRYKHRVSLGDGGNKEMIKAIRAHGNFVEYVPLSLIMLTMLEFGGENQAVLHTFGGALVVGRILHVPGLNFKGTTKLRQIGMILTFGVLIGLAVRILMLAL